MCAALIFSALPLTLAASAETFGDYEYNILDDGTAEIKKYTGNDETLAIPSTIDGHTVTSIGGNAFYNCISLTAVTIPNSVTSIGWSAFEYCKSLTSITMPDSVTSIGSTAFDATAYYNDISNWEDGVLYVGNYLISGKCSVYNEKTDSLETVAEVTGDYKVKDGTRMIAGDAFSWCELLTSVTIPGSVANIDYGAFSCASLTSVTILDGVKNIGDSAFQDCSSLTSVTIPNSVISIGERAFSGCESLALITIPSSVASIGSEAFGYCASITEINVDSDNEYFSSENGVLFNKDKTKLIQYPIGKTETEYSIPSSVTIIGENAFSSCTSLTSIAIPNGVTSINDNAFSGCESLTSLAFPNSVASIGSYVFSGCTSITEINVDSDNEYFSSENGVLFNKDKTKLIQYPVGKTAAEYSIPNSVTIICNWAFENCSSLTSIVIPNGVTSIGSWSFNGCSSLTSITIPDSVTSIGHGAFCNCTLLTSVTIPNSVTSMGEWAFGYYFNNMGATAVPDFTIYGVKGSVAETYAEENNITFIEVKETASGDINGDGEVNLSDVRIMISKIASGAELTEEEIAAADLNGDGKADLSDVRLLISKIASGNA